MVGTGMDILSHQLTSFLPHVLHVVQNSCDRLDTLESVGRADKHAVVNCHPCYGGGLDGCKFQTGRTGIFLMKGP